MAADVTAHETNLRRAFTDGRKLPVQVARLSVLFEDLRLESFGAREMGPIEALDKIGKHYRYFYFLRRMLVSLDEFASAIGQLNANVEWKRLRLQFEPHLETSWDAAVKYLAVQKPKWKDLRDLIGGHFLERAAEFAVDNFKATATGKIEIVLDRDEKKGGIRLLYCQEIVATVMRYALGPGEHSDEAVAACVNELFTGMLTGVNHAVRAMHCIALVYVVDRFRDGATSKE